MPSTRRVEVATVRLCSLDVGAVAWDADRGIGAFEYEPAFTRRGLEISPLTMPLRPGIQSFTELKRETYHGLPGLLADALPDRFGNRIIDAWLARQGRNASDFTPVERLCYIGVRGMGALEFNPAIGPRASKAVPLEVAELTQLVRDIFQHRTDWVVNLKGSMAFNVVARNQDDHTRNIAFLMDLDGTWRLAPAFDVVWAYNSKGSWTNRHQMTVNGKRDGFERTDLLAVADTFGIKRAQDIIDQVTDAVTLWEKIAKDCGVEEDLLKTIAVTHRTNLP